VADSGQKGNSRGRQSRPRTPTFGVKGNKKPSRLGRLAAHRRSGYDQRIVCLRSLPTPHGPARSWRASGVRLSMSRLSVMCRSIGYSMPPV